MPKGMVKAKRCVGVYYLESKEKRHKGSPDKCFYINYQIKGFKGSTWEKIGWASEGYTITLADQIRSERVRSIRHGELLPQQKKDPLLLDVWDKYDKWIEANKSSPRHERSVYNHHLLPRFAKKRLSQISPMDVERLKNEMLKSGLAPATTKHAIVLLRQLFNRAVDWGMWDGVSPTKLVKLPKLSNQRIRFLTVAEANLLMEALEIACPQTMKYSLLALHTGLRASEIFRLTWQDVDLDNRVLHVLGKTGEREKVFMTDTVHGLLSEMQQQSGYVFKSRSGGKIKDVSRCFFWTAKRIKLNDGVDDRLYRVSFHTLRHTFASWLALRGTPLYTIKELMRHKDIKMTMRYAHLIPDHKREAINGIEQTLHEHHMSEPGNSLATLPNLLRRT